MQYTFTVLGIGSALPTVNRNPSAHLLQANGRFFLIDCGEGTQMQLRKYGVKIQKIDQIFITHLHGDHYFGLIGLLNTFQLLGREKKLQIFCPVGLKSIVELQLKISGGYLAFPYEFIEWSEDHFETIYTDETVEIQKFPLKHRIPCCGYNFIFRTKVHKINLDKVQELNVPKVYLGKAQKGENLMLEDGRLILNNQITYPLPDPIKISYCSDTAYSPEIIAFIHKAQILFHEATFLDKDIDKAKKTYHSTSSQAANIALLSEVEMLILGHFSARYPDLSKFKTEASKIFSNTYIAEEGSSYTYSKSG